MSTKTREIVLPASGAFARIERVTYGDWLSVVASKPENVALAFAAKVVTVDGHAVTQAEILDKDMDDAFAVIGMSNSLIDSAMKTMKGIA